MTNSWRLELFLFVAKMDDEHREIVRHGGDFCAALAAGRPKNEVNVVLAKFIDSVRDHFISEEEDMLATGFEGHAAHRLEHQKLLAQLFSLADGFVSGAIDDSSEALPRFVASWCDAHIKVADRQFAGFLHATARTKAAGCGGAATHTASAS